MENNILCNNQVTISGEIVSGFTFSHYAFGEVFYLFDLKVNRLSDTADIIPVMVSKRLIDVEKDMSGSFINVSGQFRSYNKYEGEKAHLMLSVFARSVEITDLCLNTNYAEFDGYVCKAPIYRKTPLGREIADVLLAVNRPYGKSDYIPCILWGRNARFSESFEVGERIKVCGRIQSRNYLKRIDEDEMEIRIAYEVSVCKVEEVTEDEKY